MLATPLSHPPPLSNRIPSRPTSNPLTGSSIPLMGRMSKSWLGAGFALLEAAIRLLTIEFVSSSIDWASQAQLYTTCQRKGEDDQEGGHWAGERVGQEGQVVEDECTGHSSTLHPSSSNCRPPKAAPSLPAEDCMVFGRL
jgi:hypothetical protein